MRHYVEHSSSIRPHAQCKEHKPKLAYRRVCQHFLNIILPDGNGSSNNCCCQPYYGYHMQYSGCKRIQCTTAGYHINTSRYHRCGMYQCRYRCRAGHRIGQPGIQRYLRTLTCSANKEAQGYPVISRSRYVLWCRQIAEELLVTQCAEVEQYQQHTHEEAKVTDTVHYKCFLGGIGIIPVLKPEAYEQVRAEPHTFPADEHNKVVSPQYQQQHGEHEEVEVGKIFYHSLIVVHV